MTLTIMEKEVAKLQRTKIQARDFENQKWQKNDPSVHEKKLRARCIMNIISDSEYL